MGKGARGGGGGGGGKRNKLTARTTNYCNILTELLISDSKHTYHTVINFTETESKQSYGA